MKYFAVILSFLLWGISTCASAQDALSGFISGLSSQSAVFSYSYVIDDGHTKIAGDGTAEIQGDSYLVKGDGLEVYCNGVCRWTVDRQSMEVVVESYDPESPDYTVNPAALLKNFDKLFSVKGCESTSSGYDYVLSPVSEKTDVESMELSLSADGKRLMYAGLTMKNGAVAAFTVPSFCFAPVSDASRFSFDVSALSADYIVTDLR